MSAAEKVPHGLYSMPELQALGVTPTTVYRMEKAGTVERIGRGQYQRVDTVTSRGDLVNIAIAAPQATICLLSALHHFGLLPERPAPAFLSLPTGVKPPQVAAPVRWCTVPRRTAEMHRSATPIGIGDAMIWVYSEERSLAEALKDPDGRVVELGTVALKAWLRRADTDPQTLLDVAHDIRAVAVMKEALANA